MKKSTIFAISVLLLFISLSLVVQITPEDGRLLGIDVTSSLFLAAVVIGAIDGFNPCAMWVLIYLITVASQIQDKKRAWMLIGIFLTTSAILYYILLAGWLNLFLIAKVRFVMIVVGIIALAMGTQQLVEYIREKGQVTCKIGDAKSKKKTMSRIDKIMAAEITFLSLLATIGLAFTVNMVEFLCSVGLPALYTQIVAASGIPVWEMYVYNAIYTLAFMIDDIIIFCLALFALQSVDLNKYASASKLIGGLIMIGLGVALLFFPSFLG